MLDEIQLNQQFEQLAMGLPRRPWRKRNKSRRQRESNSSEVARHFHEAGPGMSLLQLLQNCVVYRLHGAGYEEASGCLEPRQQIALFEEVLDLDGGIVRETRKFPVQR